MAYMQYTNVIIAQWIFIYAYTHEITIWTEIENF